MWSARCAQRCKTLRVVAEGVVGAIYLRRSGDCAWFILAEAPRVGGSFGEIRAGHLPRRRDGLNVGTGRVVYRASLRADVVKEMVSRRV
jgi:hypothetical protein